MSLREATANDLPTIRAIAYATWPVAYAAILSPAQLDYMLERMYSVEALTAQMTAGHRFFLLYAGGNPIGFAGYEPAYQGGPHTRLHKLYVLPEKHGHGHGAALLEAVHQEALKAGSSAVELNVNRFNPTKQWYLSRGYHVHRDEVIDIGQGYVMDDHVMLCPLKTNAA